MRQHRTAAKAPDGLLAEVDETRPTLARQANELRNDYDALLAQVLALRNEAQQAAEAFQPAGNPSAKTGAGGVADFGAMRRHAEQFLAGLQEAKEAETTVLAAEDPASLPPLLGVPTAIKDLNLTKGVPTKLGSASYADFVSPIDANIVELLRAAGTISLGKTATPEFGLPCYTETDIGPPTRSPWDPTRMAGGSSGI